MIKKYNLKLFVSFVVFFTTFFCSCSVSKKGVSVVMSVENNLDAKFVHSKSKTLKLGNERMDIYLPVLKDADIALVVNHSSLINQTHLLDTLIARGIQVKKIFALEHGYRGTASNGEEVNSSVDPLTGIPIVSLYGKDKKPSAKHLKGIDIVLFDIQDVGLRFYTYISSMHYIMEACGEQKKKFMVLDRPNPNGHYFDGPILEKPFSSFIGMHQIPVVHGLTVGELAWMINEKEWTASKCDLFIVPCANYNHSDVYELTVRPSPNLPNMRSVYLYPSLCFFEGTQISVGRGTDFPFQRYGHPLLEFENDSFIPTPNEGSKYPKLEGETCFGQSYYKENALNFRKDYLDLESILDVYHRYPEKKKFFLDNGFFNLLAGTDKLMNQIKDSCSFEEIQLSWKKDLKNYSMLRAEFLIYPDFIDRN
jgi:uncharacterized protein YbbC (DUF1343 family)